MAKSPRNAPTTPTGAATLPAIKAIDDPENPTVNAAIHETESEVIDGEASEAEGLAKPKLPALELGGVYKVKHGNYKLGDRTFAPGSKFRLSHKDALLGLAEGVIEPADAATKALVADNEGEIKKLYDGRHKYVSPLAVAQDSV